MQRSRIIGTGSYLPARRITNDQLISEMGVDTNDAWIRERTGIGARHMAAPDEATSDMAAKSAIPALKMAGIAPADVEMIIVGTISPDMQFPSSSALVQAKIGAPKAACFDVSAACAGSLYALSIADNFLKTGMYKNALIIGAELLSRIIDWKDRTTCVLFGDAAGAMVLAPDPRAGLGILSTHLHTDGSQGELLSIPGGGSRKPISQEVLDNREMFVKMQGREVFKTAVRSLESVSREALEKNGLRTSDVKHVIAHQANLRILEAVMKRLEIPLDKCHLNIEQVGNTSSASVPLTLDQANRQGALAEGDLILMMAIGGGMSWGSALVRW
jgi:3-oxoacyl-[acyl-carrier-protein] synthase-3